MKQRRERFILQRVGQKLKALRKKKRISQEVVKDELGINISDYENGIINIGLSLLYTLCRYYDTSLKHFFEDDIEL